MEGSTTALLDLGANVVALVHIGYFVFVVGGAAAIVAGHLKGWRWILDPWFRVAHVVAVYVVLFEEITGIPCVLNLLQWFLRSEATGRQEATDGFSGHLDDLLYRTVSPLALDIIYWSMGALVLLLLWKVPMRSRKHAGSVESAKNTGQTGAG